MKPLQVMVLGMALVFIVLGTTWFIVIQKRLAEFLPRPVLQQATAVAVPADPAAPEPLRIRSPHAKDYHFFLFETLTFFEYLFPVFYVLAGIFILRQFVFSLPLATGILTADLMFKLFAVLYMAFCAAPLSALTHNPNVMQLYFLPSKTIYAEFSSLITGLKLFMPQGIYFVCIYVIYFVFCFWLLSRPDVRQFLLRNKKSEQGVV